MYNKCQESEINIVVVVLGKGKLVLVQIGRFENIGGRITVFGCGREVSFELSGGS